MSPLPGGSGSLPRSGFDFVMFGFAAALSTGQTRFVVPFSNAAVETVEASAVWVAPRAGVLSAFRIHTGNAPHTGTAQTVYTIRVNGVNTALRITQVLADGLNVADLIHRVELEADDEVSLSAVTTGAGVFPGAMFASLEFT